MANMALFGVCSLFDFVLEYNKGGEYVAKELSEEAKEARRQYHREWQRKNKDRVRKYVMNYWERLARESREGKKEE